MKNLSANSEGERFQRDAEKYAAYLQTPEGRLRLDLPFASIQEVLSMSTIASRALDIGGGTGALTVRLARLGLHVTLLDGSQSMLELAERAAQEAGVTERITLQHGDAAELPNLFAAETFDLILCHNVLEFVGNACAVLGSAARMLRHDSGIISILVRNQAGEVLKTALLNGDLTAAEESLTSEWGDESLYGGRVRLFTPESLKGMVTAASLAMIVERGVRVLSDYLPATVSRQDEYNRIYDLERKLGGRPEFAAVARYTHCLARRSGPAIEDSR
jgi:S-adenosylmethionine-dependent methyltransferase